MKIERRCSKDEPDAWRAGHHGMETGAQNPYVVGGATVGSRTQVQNNARKELVFLPPSEC